MVRCFHCLLLLALAAPLASAQERGRGDDGDRREEGRGEGEGRGDEGRGRWGGGGGPGDFLRRMDVNGNGMIDPEEAEGRAGFFLKRIAENNPDIDLSQPVPLEKLEQATAAARERWGVGRGDQGRDEGRRSEEERGGSSSSTNAAASKTPERLVPGFGEATETPAVPGFGLLSQALAMIKVTDADRAEAQRRFGRYDSDGNGVIEGEEMERARSRDYDEYDSNKDGKLTLDELALRYAKRRVEEAAAAKAAAVASSASSSSSSRRDEERSRDSGKSTSSSRSSSKSTAAKPYRIADAEERLAKKGVPNWFMDKDEDGDGQVAMAEYGESWSESALADFAKYDLNSDGMITPEECLRAAKLSGTTTRGGYASSRTGGSSRSSSGYGSRTEVAKADPPKTSPTTSSGASATKSPAADEEEVEADDEAETTGDAAAAAGSTTKTTSAESSGESNPSSTSTAAKPATEPIATAPAAAESVAVDPRYLSYAQGRIKQVDTNGDGMLQPGEWINMSKSPATADVNGDQRITPHELALYFQKQ